MFYATRHGKMAFILCYSNRQIIHFFTMLLFSCSSELKRDKYVCNPGIIISLHVTVTTV